MRCINGYNQNRDVFIWGHFKGHTAHTVQLLRKVVNGPQSFPWNWLEMYKLNWLIKSYDSCCSEMAKCSSLTESINWSQRQSACCQTVKAKQGCCLGICGSDRPAATQLFLVTAASFPKKKSQTSVTLWTHISTLFEETWQNTFKET